MNLRTYQEAVMRGLCVKEGVDPGSHCAHGLAGEAGEVNDLIKKAQYENAPPLNVTRLLEECGDVLWYLTHLIGHYGYSLEEIAGMNIEKLAERRPAQYAAYVTPR